MLTKEKTRLTNNRPIANGRSNENRVESSVADKLEPITYRNTHGVIDKLFECPDSNRDQED